MGKIGLIIRREYLSRVRKKSFLVMIILGPLFFASILFAPLFFAENKNENHKIIVVDGTNSLCGLLKSNSTVNYNYNYCAFELNKVVKIFQDSEKVSVLYIPATQQLMQVTLYSKVEPGIDVVSAINYQLNNSIEREKMKAENLSQDMIDRVKTSVQVNNIVNNKKSEDSYNMLLSTSSAVLIYLFVLLYSVQVMRGVMEEKTNRIVEIIISSVKPFQLMMGKVIGVGLVGFTQFIIWVTLSYGAYFGGTNYLQSKMIETPVQQQTYKQGMPQNTASAEPAKNTMQNNSTMSLFNSIDDALRATNWVLMIGCFLFYFIAGYLFYSSICAAVGSALDSEADTQQFMLPVSAPLLFSIIIMQSVIRNPHSDLAFWCSMIPFTSPIVMMARIPFGIPAWQLPLSMVLLIVSIFLVVWLAGRVYKIGLLMYGKKVSWGEMGKWIFYK